MGKSARACLILSVSLLAAAFAHAAELKTSAPGWDVGLKVGAISGQVVYERYDSDLKANTRTRLQWGGIPVALSLALPVQKWLTLSPSFGVNVDPNLGRITRKGFELTNEFHLLGTAFGYGKPNRTNHNLSFLARLGLQFYDDLGQSTPIPLGGLLEASFGASYRLDFGRASSLALSLLTTPGGVPTGEERFSVSLYSTELEWRQVL